MMIHHVFLVCYLVYGVMAACPPKITPKPVQNAGVTTSTAATIPTTVPTTIETTTGPAGRKKRESKDGEPTSHLNDVEDVNPAPDEKCDNSSSTLILSIPTIVISITAYLIICVH